MQPKKQHGDFPVDSEDNTWSCSLLGVWPEPPLQVPASHRVWASHCPPPQSIPQEEAQGDETFVQKNVPFASGQCRSQSLRPSFLTSSLTASDGTAPKDWLPVWSLWLRKFMYRSRCLAHVAKIAASMIAPKKTGRTGFGSPTPTWKSINQSQCYHNLHLDRRLVFLQAARRG